MPTNIEGARIITILDSDAPAWRNEVIFVSSAFLVLVNKMCLIVSTYIIHVGLQNEVIME